MKTIAALWKEFNICIGQQREYEDSPMYHDDPKFAAIYALAKSRQSELRAELLDRCANEYGLNVVGLMVWHDPKKVGWNGPKNYGSAWLFMEWELEQRAKEGSVEP